VDFDPVRAKAEGRPTGLPDDIAALFPDSFEDSELGEIPRGWKVNTVEESAEKVACGPFGSSIKVSTFVPKGVPIISGQHLNGIRLLDQANSFITTEHAEKLKNANVYRGDVIFTHAGNIGQVAFIPETSKYDRYVLSQRQFYLRCNREIVSPFYMAHYFKSPDGQHKLLANTSSTGVPSISRPVSYLKSIKFVLPPKDLIDAFDEYVRPTHLLAAKNDDESNTLASLRDTLLPKLISGELRVPDAEKFVEEAGV
jgi:type I restriction enzyme S subunit